MAFTLFFRAGGLGFISILFPHLTHCRMFRSRSASTSAPQTRHLYCNLHHPLAALAAFAAACSIILVAEVTGM